MVILATTLRLDLNALDYAILAIYFLVVLGIGLLARRSIITSEDFLLAGRSLPAWVTGLAFVSANLGATEILGMAANGAQYGISTLHFYWIGAVPAMVFLGLVMMPFYYRSRVRSVPEYLLRRFNPPTHIFNALTFAVASMLTAGVNLYALAIILQALLGWSLLVAILVSAVFVLAYIMLGGLSGAIYNEVLQFFVIVAGLMPVVIIGLVHVGGWSGLKSAVSHTQLGSKAFSTWQGTGIPWSNPLGDWIGIVFGLGFVLSFGYWTTNFAEVQRALSARDLSAAQRTPLIGAYPKIFIPALTIIPGLVALAVSPHLGKTAGLPYNDAIPLLMNRFLPNGVLGVAMAGLLASFMAGMAANVSSFNTVVTYDLWQRYVRRDRPDAYYLLIGRVMTVIGVLIGIVTAFIASGYSNLMNYLQLLFSFFNAPLFATFIIAMYWRRVAPMAGVLGLAAGTAAAAAMHFIAFYIPYFYPGGHMDSTHATINAQMQNFYGAIAAFVVDAVVTVIVTYMGRPKPVAELGGLVWGIPDPNAPDPSTVRRPVWYESPMVLGSGAILIIVVLSVIFR
jgi:SSS family solute:Na+ symporter